MLDNKTVLITGGTGSFGKEFLKDILTTSDVKKVVIFSRDEFKQDLLKKELMVTYPSEIASKVRFFIGDIRDLNRLKRAFNGIDIVIHAAAMKQVPACEYNPSEAIKTNVDGAINIIDAALDCGVEKVVALSTDKAVNPINLYGGTKLVSDKLFVSANAYSGSHGTTFSVVRYGNVSGSRGSIIPFFNNLLENGIEELPITDLRMTRFWMTLDKAVNLVKLAINEMEGGETFVFKNPSYKVTDIAKALGGDDIKMKSIGIREGEKIHECMITKDDSRLTYDFGDYYIIFPHFEWFKVSKRMDQGVRVKDGFEYDSGANSEWLSVEDIRNLCEEYKLT